MALIENRAIIRCLADHAAPNARAMVLNGRSVLTAALVAFAGLSGAAFAVQPVATNLGQVGGQSGNLKVQVSTISDGTVAWFRIDLAVRCVNSSNTYLDIDNAGSTPGLDTFLIMFDSVGNLAAFDSDNGGDQLAQLSFGQILPPRTAAGASSGGVNFDGRNGALNAGLYYIAVCVGAPDFGFTQWDVTPAPAANQPAQAWQIALTLRTNTGIQTPPCGLADVASDSLDIQYNPNGSIGSEDLDAFIAGFVGNVAPIADIASDSLDSSYNPNGSVGSEDLDAFIASFVAGC